MSKGKPCEPESLLVIDWLSDIASNWETPMIGEKGQTFTLASEADQRKIVKFLIGRLKELDKKITSQKKAQVKEQVENVASQPVPTQPPYYQVPQQPAAPSYPPPNQPFPPQQATPPNPFPQQQAPQQQGPVQPAFPGYPPGFNPNQQ